jgi:iron-sulfur cluster assembly protein
MDRIVVALGEGKTLLEGVLKGGAFLAHDCGGKLACATCCVIVHEGRERLDFPSDDELDILDRAGAAAEGGARLACQATGRGEVSVGIPQLRAPPQSAPSPLLLAAEAVQFLQTQLAKHPGAACIRLAVKPAGCSGLRYSVEALDAARADDALFEFGGLRVAIDPASLPFIAGTTVRLAHEGLARRLRFDNPNARQSCGCGESFGT